MKNKKMMIFLIVILSLLSLFFLIFMGMLLHGNIKFSKLLQDHKISNELVLDKEYNLDFKKIAVKVHAGDIHIKNASDHKTRVVIHGKKENTNIKANDNELSIDIKTKPCIGICFNQTIAKVEIYLPKDYANKIELINNYGDTKVEDFLHSEVHIEEKCGDVEVLGAKNVTLSNEYGDIVLKKASTADIEQSAGDIKVEEVSDIKAYNHYGNIDVKKITNALDIKNDCGDISIDDLYLRKNSVVKDNFGDIKIGQTNQIFIDGKTDLGDVRIQKNVRDAEVTLKIRNDCGDIKVENEG